MMMRLRRLRSILKVMKNLCLQTLLCPHPSRALSKSGNRAIFDVFRQIITITLLFFWKVQHTASLKNQDKNIVKVCRKMSQVVG